MSAHEDSGTLSAAALSRRTFVRASLIGGAVGAALPAANGWSADAAPVRAFEFEDASLAHLQAAMESGRSTSAKLTAAYRARIAEIDVRGPELRSVIEVNRTRRPTRRRSTRAPDEGRPRSPARNSDPDQGQTWTSRER